MMVKQLKGKLVEVAGEIVGYVVMDNKKTLLIREAHYSSERKSVWLTEKAMFFDKSLIANAYWIRFKNLDVPTRSFNGRGDVRGLLNM